MTAIVSRSVTSEQLCKMYKIYSMLLN